MLSIIPKKLFIFLLYSILLIAAGCAEKPTKHVYINENPAAIQQVLNTPVINPESLAQDTSVEEIKPIDIALHKTAWDRLFSLYALADIDNERIDQEVKRFLKHPEYLTKIQHRAEPYLYFILDQVERKQIPGEFALLPVIESAFLPNAVSKSKASGLWQFMPATGRFFGLKQNWWYDGRNDIYTSTQAATTYLQQLGKLFDNDWLLALASYNAGKGNIKKAQKLNSENNLTTDYWSIPLPTETMNYVPRLLAIAKIFANSEKYNIALYPIDNKPYFEVVTIDSQIDLSLAAKMAQTPINSFFTLNPGFKRWSTDPDGPYHLLIHVEKVDTFNQQLMATQIKDRMHWIRHKINQGENLGVIAEKYNTTVNALKQSNHLDNANIRAGKYLMIPHSSAQSVSDASTIPQQLYIVKSGDTFWGIARQFAVKSKDIAKWNNVPLSKTLQPGQKLIIKEG
ncbi:MAG: transglycosylase SLT domain-containing protein [Methylococcales symbiont of Hymedesmia sp. n. MRB-2018]|nr:MAG: transglycosylase SLT domain-containing protein [Methylococcales symbiont of Hymedesmia sp. n. MRB-2018]